MTKAQLLALRDRLYLNEEIPDEALDADEPPYYRPPEGSPAHEYLVARRKVLAGPAPFAGRASRHGSPRPIRRPSRTFSPARGARRCPRRWRSPGCSGTSSGTRTSADWSCRSSPTRRGPSASSRSSPSRRSTHPKASATPRSTPVCRSRTPRAVQASCSRRASPKPARWRRSPR